jgi:Rieske Fe-S protein
MKDDISRRDLLRSAALLVIGGIPSTLLGRILPSDRDTEGRITYTLNIDDYPQLKSVGGSVKLVSEQQMKFNPDHVTNHDYLKAAPRGRYPIAITRVAESGPDMFAAVSTFCSHGAGFQLNDFDPVAGEFHCPHRGSTFTACGVPVRKPDAPTGLEPLRCFPVVYDAARKTLTLTRDL